MYSEPLFKDVLDNIHNGVEIISNLRYADDAVLVSESAEELHRLINSVETTLFNRYGMKINCKKTPILDVFFRFGFEIMNT